jgi:hypothetical protein
MQVVNSVLEQELTALELADVFQDASQKGIRYIP